MATFLNRKIFPATGGGDLTITGQQVLTGTLMEDVEAFDTVRYEEIYFEELAQPATLPAFNPASDFVETVVSDEDGVYWAVKTNQNNSLVIYKRENDTFTALTNPVGYPGNIQDMQFDPTGTYLFMASAFAPYIFIAKRTNDSFSLLSTPVDTPDSAALNIVSADGVYWIASFFNSPRNIVYKRDGDVFTKLNDFDVPIPGAVFDMTISSDGVYVGVSHQNSPRISIYKRTGDNFNKLPNPTAADGYALPIRDGNSISFSRNNTYLVLGSDVNDSAQTQATPLAIYKRTNDDFERLTGPVNEWYMITGSSLELRDVVFTPDSAHLLISAGLGSVGLYKRVDDNFYLIPILENFAPGVPGRALSPLVMTFSPNNNYLVVGGSGNFDTQTGSGIKFYKVLKNVIYKANNSSKTTKAIGYVSESGTAGQTKDVVSLFEVI